MRGRPTLILLSDVGAPKPEHIFKSLIIIIIINDTLARSLEPVVTECKEHTIHTQTQVVVASRKPKEIKRTHEGEYSSI